MADGCFHTLSVTQFLQAVNDFHARVAQNHGRIELTLDGCDDVCILISKAELQSLERALEILSQTTDFRAMCEHLAQLAQDGNASSAAASPA